MPLPNRTWSLGADQKVRRLPSWEMPVVQETWPSEPSTLAPAFKEKPIMRVRSWLLGGEIVVFAADHARIPESNTEVVYRASELQLIQEMTPEQLIALHQVKKALDGDLLGLHTKEK